VTVTLRGGDKSATLDQAPVSVDLVSDRRKNVLAVPVTALQGTAKGGYAVAVRDGDKTRLLAVTPGLFADGQVEIEGAGVHEGLRVVAPQ
jgi:multidrug efflux pump subunit AcrA (membrane-fusion protein)